MEKELQDCIDNFKSNKLFLYGNKFRLPDRNIRLDCLGFLIAVYETIGSDTKIPRFSMETNDLKLLAPESFSLAGIGDPLCFFIPGRNENRGYNRKFHHYAIKYSDSKIAHMPNVGRPVNIVQFNKYKRKETLLTKSNLIF